ncbi:MAG: ion transporter [Candidatus Obscuribacterales bacterium]
MSESIETEPEEIPRSQTGETEKIELASEPELRPDPDMLPEPGFEKQSGNKIKDRLYTIIFEADTLGGRAFDIWLLIAILGSVIVVLLDSVRSINAAHAKLFTVLEWTFTVMFTIEYLLRIYCSTNRSKYLRSFFGIIDLVAIVPSYIGIFLTGAQYLIIVRTLRLLRLFRIFKLGRYLKEAEVMSLAIRSSGPKIMVFLFVVLSMVTIIGALMYLVEGGENGFTSIPRSIYWAIVTLTTVGYGDIAPTTVLGQILACTVMILGYGIIAVPTGIVSVEMHKAGRNYTLLKNCNNCGAKGHEEDSTFCKHCGTRLSVVEINR